MKSQRRLRGGADARRQPSAGLHERRGCSIVIRTITWAGPKPVGNNAIDFAEWRWSWQRIKDNAGL